MGRRGGLVGILAVCALGGCVAASSTAAVPSMTMRAAKAQPAFLYVLRAREGWAERRPNGHWRLSLLGVSLAVPALRPPTNDVGWQIALDGLFFG